MYIKKLVPKFYFDYFGEVFEKYIESFDLVLGEIYNEFLKDFSFKVTAIEYRNLDNLWKVIPWFGVMDRRFVELYVYFPWVKELRGTKYAFEYILSCLSAVDLKYAYLQNTGDYLTCGDAINVGNLPCGEVVEGYKRLSKITIYNFANFEIYNEFDELVYSISGFAINKSLEKFIRKFLVSYFLEIFYEVIKKLIRKLDVFRFRDGLGYNLSYTERIWLDMFVLINSSWTIAEFNLLLGNLISLRYSVIFKAVISDVITKFEIGKYFMNLVRVLDLSRIEVMGRVVANVFCANVCTFRLDLKYEYIGISDNVIETRG